MKKVGYSHLNQRFPISHEERNQAKIISQRKNAYLLKASFILEILGPGQYSLLL